jgi:hypothetical protein
MVKSQNRRHPATALESAAKILWVGVLVLTAISLQASIIARADTLTNYRMYPILFLVPTAVLASLIGVFPFLRQQDDRKAFA